MQTTVGIDYGEITLDDGVKIGLYGTPDNHAFDFIWPVICQGCFRCYSISRPQTATGPLRRA